MKRKKENGPLFSQSGHQKQSLQLMCDLHSSQLLLTTKWQSSDTTWLCPGLKGACPQSRYLLGRLKGSCIQWLIDWGRGYKNLASSSQSRTTLKSQASSRAPCGSAEVFLVTALWFNFSLCPDLLLFLCSMCCSWEHFSINFLHASPPWELDMKQTA